MDHVVLIQSSGRGGMKGWSERDGKTGSWQETDEEEIKERGQKSKDVFFLQLVVFPSGLGVCVVLNCISPVPAYC